LLEAGHPVVAVKPAGIGRVRTANNSGHGRCRGP
jgi:hypothetical protein